MRKIFDSGVSYGIIAIIAFLLSILCGLDQEYTAAAIYLLAGMFGKFIMEYYRIHDEG